MFCLENEGGNNDEKSDENSVDVDDEEPNQSQSKFKSVVKTVFIFILKFLTFF